MNMNGITMMRMNVGHLHDDISRNSIIMNC